MSHNYYLRMPFGNIRRERISDSTSDLITVTCELSQYMGKTEFSSTAKNRTNSVSQVRNLGLIIFRITGCST